MVMVAVAIPTLNGATTLHRALESVLMQTSENLDSFVDCAPCWRWNTCDFERKCLTMITPDRVLGALDRVLAKRGQPLEVETVEL